MVNRKAEVPCSRSSYLHLQLCTVERPLPPPLNTWQTFFVPGVGGSVVSFLLREIASVVLLPSRKQLQIEEELFGWVGTIYIYIYINYWMKLNRSKYMPRRKNREVLTVEVPRKDGSQENMASFFFSGKMPLSQTWFVSLMITHFHSLQSC